MDLVTISAKIPRSLKKKLEQYGVKVSEVVRGALDYEVRRVEELELAKRLEKISQQLRGKITREDVAKAVRAVREEE